jgi:hypothetical protein
VQICESACRNKGRIIASQDVNLDALRRDTTRGLPRLAYPGDLLPVPEDRDLPFGGRSRHLWRPLDHGRENDTGRYNLGMPWAVFGEAVDILPEHNEPP